MHPAPPGRPGALALALAIGIGMGMGMGRTLVAASADAQSPANDFGNMSLEDLGTVKVPLVVGASKHEQKITEAPAAVSIVTRQDIEEYGYRTLADVLNSVRGLYTTFDRGYSFLGMQGVNRLGDFGGRTLLNVNGHRINEPIYDASFFGYDFPLDVDLIERVEVIRGPGSSLYGNNAFFGIVNVVTREGDTLAHHGLEASVLAGEWNTLQGRLSYGSRLTNGIELLLSGTCFESAGNPSLDFPASDAASFPGAIDRRHDGESARQLFASVRYRDWTVEGLYDRRDKEMPNGPYGAIFNDGRNWVWDQRAYAEIRYDHECANWQVMGRTYFDHYSYRGNFVYDYGDPYNPGLTINHDTPQANWWGGELQLSRTLWERHRLTMGVEGRHDFQQHQENADVAPAFVYINSSESPFSLAAYVQDEFALLKNLTLNAGLRYDYFSTFGSTANPRAGIIYQPWTESVFKALYGQAFRAPNAYEFDFEGPYYKSNHQLDPETIRSYELVWEQGFARNYRVTGTLFYHQVEDLITQDVDPNPADPRLVFNNTDSVDIQGGELEVEAKWAHGFRARASYAFADAVDNDTGRRLQNSPRHMGKWQVTIPLYPDRLLASAEVLAMSSRRTAYNNRLPGHAVVNFTLFSRELVRNLDLSASIYNLLNKQYYDPASPDFHQELNPRDGRTFQVKATYRF